MFAMTEGRVLEIVDRVRVHKARVEDDRVELKASWPDPRKVARQLAAHANVAHGVPILWIIGVDEKEFTAPGASGLDMADWWPVVRSGFDEVAPELRVDLSVPIGKGRSVVALEFATDRAPYLVSKGDSSGRFEREVPWRDGTNPWSRRHRVPLSEIAAVEWADTRFAGKRAILRTKGGEEIPIECLTGDPNRMSRWSRKAMEQLQLAIVRSMDGR